MAVSGYSRGSSPLAAYTYNADGLRVTKKVAGKTNTFTWEASSGIPLLVYDGSTYYLYGPDGRPFEQVDASGAVTWYHHDQLGSTRVLSNSAGSTVATATYDPYGRLTASTGRLSPLGFAGEYTDAETGFVYLRARYYDPGTAQFLTVDPAYSLTNSRHGYVDGDPLNFTDPLGLLSFGDIREFVTQHYDTIGTLIGVAACLSPAAVVCAAGLAIGFPARATKRIQDQGFNNSLGENVSDLTLTVATFGLVRLPGKFIPGREIGIFTRSTPWQLWQRLSVAALRAQVGLTQLLGNALNQRRSLAAFGGMPPVRPRFVGRLWC